MMAGSGVFSPFRMPAPPPPCDCGCHRAWKEFHADMLRFKIERMEEQHREAMRARRRQAQKIGQAVMAAALAVAMGAVASTVGSCEDDVHPVPAMVAP